SWRHQIEALAPEFFVVAPTLRGYGASDRPKTIEAYRLPHLAADVLGLIRALGRDQARVVGHDWGGGIAWYFALTQPAAVEKLAVLNCPHPAIFARALRTNLRQLRRSWYMFFFQLPRLPEWVLSRADFAALERGFRGWVKRQDRQVFSDQDLDRLK